MEIRRLNSLRALAVLLVLVSHFSNATNLWGKYFGDGVGQLGVMLFFILSGFLMAHIYWRKQPSARGLYEFFISRFARVVPLYLVIVFLSFFTPYFYKVKDIRSLISHLLFLNGEGVLWTIPPEIQFYVIFGLAWFFFKKRSELVVVLMAVLFMLSYFILLRNETTEISGLKVGLVLINALPYFLVGSFLGFIYGRLSKPVFPQKHVYVLALLILLLLVPHVFLDLFQYSHRMWEDMGILVLMTIMFFSVVFLVPNGNILIENRIGDFIGKISYSLYLLHVPVLAFTLRLKLSTNLLVPFVVFLALAITIAWISFSLLENPIRKAFRRLITTPKTAEQPVAVAPPSPNG